MIINNNRPSKIEYYLGIAKEVASRSTCLRKHYGAVIVKNDQIVSTGYNGAPRYCKNCCDLNVCYRKEHNIPSGSNYELCKSVHAEQNALLNAGRSNCVDAGMYIYGIDVDTNVKCSAYPCIICTKLIINSNINIVYMSMPNVVYNDQVDVWFLDRQSLYNRYNELFKNGQGV